MDTNKAIQEFFSFRTAASRDNLPMVPTRVRSGGPAVRNAFGKMFFEFGFNKGVEVGTRKGEFARILCEGNPNLHLTCVDPWAPYSSWNKDRQEQMYNIAVENLKPLNVTIVRKPSLEAVKSFRRRSIDFVYIDGDHTFDEVVRDIIEWSRRVRSGGIVACHDYNNFYKGGVVQAVDAFTRCHHIDPWFVTREQEPTAFWVRW